MEPPMSQPDPPILNYQGPARPVPVEVFAPIEVTAAPQAMWPQLVMASVGLVLLVGGVGLMVILLLAWHADAAVRSPVYMILLVGSLVALGLIGTLRVVRMIIRLARHGEDPVRFIIRRGYSLTVHHPQFWEEPRTWLSDEIEHLDIERLGRLSGGGRRFNVRIFLVTAEVVLISLRSPDDEFVRLLEEQLLLVREDA
jgi:hypothetical protein